MNTVGPSKKDLFQTGDELWACKKSDHFLVFGTALSAGQREDFRRRQATQRQRAKQARQRYQQSGPTFYLRPNSFSDLTFQEFAARLHKILLK